MHINQNLIEISGNFISGFFPDFPDPVFSWKKFVGELGGGQILAHFIAHVKISCFKYKLKLGHDGADAKNRENHIYVVVQCLLNNL